MLNLLHNNLSTKIPKVVFRNYKTVRVTDGFALLKENYQRQREFELKKHEQSSLKETQKDVDKEKQKKLEPAFTQFNLACPGCGGKYHYKFPQKPGYVDYEKLVQWNTKTALLCDRCKSTSDGTPYHKMYSISEGKFRNIIGQLTKRNAIAVIVCDIVGFPGTLPPEFENSYPPNRPVILALNKCDVLAHNSKQVDFIQNYYGFLVNNWERENNFQFSDIVYTSGRKGIGLPELSIMLQKYMFQSEFQTYDFCYLLGNTNAGKSTMFNKLSPLMSDKIQCVGKVTESEMPGTTVTNINTVVDPPSPRNPRDNNQILSQKVSLLSKLLLERDGNESRSSKEYAEWYKSSIDLQINNHAGKKLLVDTPGVLPDNTLPESTHACQNQVVQYPLTLNPGECLSFGWYQIYYINGVNSIKLGVKTSVIMNHTILSDIDDDKIGYTPSGVKLENKLYVVNNIGYHNRPVGDIVLGNFAWLSIKLSAGDFASVLLYGPRLKDISYRTPSFRLHVPYTNNLPKSRKLLSDFYMKTS